LVGPSLVDADPSNDHIDVEEEEPMFQQAKVYADHGIGCFINKEILSICLLGIMHNIKALLKTYGRVVAQFKDVQQPFLTTILYEKNVSHFSDPAKSCNLLFLPSLFFIMLRP
jgi:hypothetical protein